MPSVLNPSHSKTYKMPEDRIFGSSDNTARSAERNWQAITREE